MTHTLLSGCIGALIVQIMSMLWSEYKLCRERKSLLKGIVTECEYNISIIDEILDGVIKHNGSFKRLSIEYFRMVREMSSKYKFSNKLMFALSRLIVDLELFNREADYVFNGHEERSTCKGQIGNEAIVVTHTNDSRDISAIISAARDGVVGSLKGLKQIAEKKVKGE